MSILILGGLVLLAGIAIVRSSRTVLGPQDYMTRVPVDDFVVGDLPMICARSGRSADGLVEVESREGNFQTWWLLLLVLGPLGIVAIVLLWTVAPNVARVGGSVPMTRTALDEQNRAIVRANWGAAMPILAFAAGLGAFVVPGQYLDWLPVSRDAIGIGFLLVAVFGGFVGVAILSSIANRRRVSVRLDGTRRWVEIRNVHGDFARAVDRQVRARHEAARNRAPR